MSQAVTYTRHFPPEIDLIVLSFLGHFAWEILQAPMFSSMNQVDHFSGIFICLKATLGDLLTIGLEYLHTEITGRWAYNEAMPLLPVIGTGLSPILQWIFVPLLVLWYLSRLDSKTDNSGLS